MNADGFIQHLQLQPHPEGGYYNRSVEASTTTELEGKTRDQYTSIYFLLKSGQVSHFHRLQSDEVWYYHAGSALTIHMIDENGVYRQQKLGLQIENGELPQLVVPKHTIFGSSLLEEHGQAFSLVGCMVSPGFDFEDFELFTTAQLMQMFPQHEIIIRKMTLPSI